MKNRIFTFLASAALCAALTCSVLAAYPSSNTKIPDGSALLEGEQIGEERGWDGQHTTGRQSAFDGDKYTYYDPTQQGADYAYCGLELDDRYILTKVMVLPRENWTDRFEGACIQGSNDCEEWYTLCESNSPASSWDWQEFTEFEANIGYQYYRYYNPQNHGDVAEVEFYGYKGTNGTDPYNTSEAISVSEINVTYSMLNGEQFTATVSPGGAYPDTSSLHADEYNGMVFGGWSYSEGGEKEKADGDTVTMLSDHTLYAVWYSSDAIPTEETEDTDDSSADNAQAEEDTATDSTAEEQSGQTGNGHSTAIIIVCIAIMVVSIAVTAVVVTKSLGNNTSK